MLQHGAAECLGLLIQIKQPQYSLIEKGTQIFKTRRTNTHLFTIRGCDEQVSAAREQLFSSQSSPARVLRKGPRPLGVSQTVPVSAMRKTGGARTSEVLGSQPVLLFMIRCSLLTHPFCLFFSSACKEKKKQKKRAGEQVKESWLCRIKCQKWIPSRLFGAL